MPRVRLLDKVFNIEFAPFAPFKRTNSLVDFGAKSMKLLYVGQEPATNLFLIGLRQVGNFGYRFLKQLGHI
jgi:hypothetical protein